MFQNYLRIASRAIKKQLAYTGFNILGLSVAFAACTLILIYLIHETSYEKFHTQSDRIFRITHHYQASSGFEVHWARVPVDFVNKLPAEIPEIKKLIRFQNHERKYVKIGSQKFRPKHVYATDADVFEVFDFPLLKGDAQSALANPYSVVITQDLAQKYFENTESALGQKLIITSDYQAEEKIYTIRGVMKDVPPNTHLPIDMLISFTHLEERTGWAYVYTLLEKNTDIASLKPRLSEFVVRHQEAETQGKITFIPQALGDIHLHSDLAREILPNGSHLYVKILSFVGLFILLIALFNFINLNNALTTGRTKEVGMRSILGESRGQMILGGVSEAVAYSIVAYLVGLALAFFILPYLENILGIDIPVNYFKALGCMLAAALVSSILISIYPAFILPSLPSLKLLKPTYSSKIAYSKSPFRMKRIMIMLQFCISIILIASTLIARQQIRYIHDKQLGITKDQILALSSVPIQVRENFQKFSNQITSIPAVQQVAACMEVPSREIRDSGPVLIQGVNDDPHRAPMMDAQVISPEFIALMEIQLLAGENPFDRQAREADPVFTDNFTPTDYLITQERSYLINETAMKKLGWNSPEEAIGQRINWSIGEFELAFGPVAGVVKDFHQESLKHTIDPIVMFYEPIWLNTFLIKLHSAEISQTLSHIQQVWDNLFPSYPFEYEFLDELYDGLYKQERIQLQLLMAFSGLALMLAFMGLFALIAFSLKTRMKEIALRKILGANQRALIHLFSREYIALLVISGLIAVPISYIYIQKWLQIFAYQIEVRGVSYVLTLVLIAFLLLLIVTLQTLRHTRINPVEVLRED